MDMSHAPGQPKANGHTREEPFMNDSLGRKCALQKRRVRKHRRLARQDDTVDRLANRAMLGGGANGAARVWQLEAWHPQANSSPTGIGEHGGRSEGGGRP